MDPTPAPERSTVLVIEDDHATASVIHDVLQTAGYHVAIARDGATGLAHMQSSAVDLVLLDVMLPDTDGIELCRRVRAEEGAIYLPIIMLTALTTEADRHAGFAAGADDYITKPFGVENLLDRVRVWTRTSQRIREQHAALARQVSLLDLASDAILVRDLGHRITYWSAGAEALYGWARAEALGRVAHELLQTTFPAPLADIQTTILRDGSWAGELAQTRRNGSRVTVASRWALQRDAAGRPEAVLELNTDMTLWEMVRDAERARLASRLEAISRAARELADRLNNDLAMAVGTTQLLQTESAGVLPEQVHRLLDEAARGLDDAVEHIEQLNRLARENSFPPVP